MSTSVSLRQLPMIGGLDLPVVQDNLDELKEAAKQNGFEIVGDSDGLDVYYKHRFWGKLKDLTHCFYIEEKRLKFAHRAVITTFVLLADQAERVNKYLELYGDCLDKKLLTRQVRETVENAITKFNNATQSFYYFSKECPEQFEKINEFWKKSYFALYPAYFTEEYWKAISSINESKNYREYVWNYATLSLKNKMGLQIHEKSMHYQNIIDFEQKLRDPIPLKIIRVFSNATKSPDEEDLTKFRKWIKEIDQNDKITQELFLNGLRSLTAHINKFEMKSSRYSFVILKTNLIGQGCNLLRKRDEKHLEWRSALIPGSTVTCNEHRFTIKQRISPLFFSGEEERVTYSVEENPHILLLICLNKAWPAYFITLNKNEYNAIFEVDDNGNCAIIEKLYPISLKTSEVRKNLGEYLNRLLQAIQNKNHQINNDLFQRMMMTQEGFVKLDMACTDSEREPKKLTFNMIEDYIVMLAGGDLEVLQELISAAKLKVDPVAKCYFAVVEHCLNNADINIGHLAKGRGLEHREGEIRLRCLQLYQEVKVCKLNFLQYLKKNQIVLEEKAINKMILDTYKKLPCISFLPSYFESELIKAVEIKTVKKETKTDKKFLGIF